ncbi:MAG TPA: hybrid sensor histidine kinase/response regulator [Syntrophus sp. (in: bacteria)]|nr:MAG: hybrid sensor histidine kinase/response regulator [Syntrophus sp. GWC2_56_31]HBB18136.1 hybrid sensor histidine kinase/response regulator [Syntrophus sp. (in: bacteria)]
MAGKIDAFMKRLLSTFKVEADEHIKNITAGLIDLEKELEPQVKAGIIETVFREAHSLKGAARAVNRSDMETLCQSLETVFSGLKHREIDLAPALFDTLHRSVDMLNAITLSPPEEAAAGPGEISRITEKLAKTAMGESGAKQAIPNDQPVPRDYPPTSEPKTFPPGPEFPVRETDDAARTQKKAMSTVRISMEKLDSLLRQSEELLSLKLTADRHLEDVQELTHIFGLWNKQWSKIYPVICEFRRLQGKRDKQGRKRRQDDIQNVKLLEFAELTHDNMKILESRLAELRRRSDHDRYATGLMVDNLLGDVKQILMLPFSTLFEAFPKVLRDLSRDQGKEVELSISGGEIEIDRRILEEMRIVFIHLLRNTIDHGIEKPEVRKKNGKPPRGMIQIVVSRSEGNKAEILLSDDGAGIDLGGLKEASLKRGIVSPEEARKLTEQDVLTLVFQSGVSTSPIITDLSGRGLGLTIVREKIEKLGGRVLIETHRHKGTTIRMALPLTVSTFRGVLVTAAELPFIIPTTEVERTVRIKREEIRTVENRDTLSLEGIAIPLVKLSDVLELSERNDESPVITVLIMESQGKRIGFRVDEILTEQEILIKGMSRPLSRVRNIAAATILGSGKVVPVLNASDLVKSAATSAVRPAKPAAPQAGGEAAKQNILVVEDSITSRMLLKNILETSGYMVKTAVDGIDAISQLKTEKFDAVVSDVDMPRMNGFNLTEKIRGDKKLAELPVVLVTALGSREDRERGIDVGANAYIVKSSFDQSNLLETLRRLI